MENRRLYFKIIVNFFFTALLVVGAVYFVPPLLRFFLPFLIGWIIAMIANPLVRLMEKRIKIVRKHGSAIIIIAVLAAVILLLYFGIMALVRQGYELIKNLPDLYAQLEVSVNTALGKLSHIYNIMPEGVQNFVSNLGDSVGETLSGSLKNIKTPTISDAGSLAKNAADFLFAFIITILSAYFFTAERDNLVAAVKKHASASILEQYHMIVDNFKRAVGGYFKAQFKIMLIITMILFVGFEVLQIGYSFLLALGIAFLDFLPVFGTGTVIWPWALIDFITGHYGRAIGLLGIYAICQVVRQLLQPKMVGDSIGISPLQTLVFMFVGYQIGGFLGLILGIPIGMVLVNFYRAGAFNRLIRGFRILAGALHEYLKF